MSFLDTGSMILEATQAEALTLKSDLGKIQFPLFHVFLFQVTEHAAISIPKLFKA